MKEIFIHISQKKIFKHIVRLCWQCYNWSYLPCKTRRTTSFYQDFVPLDVEGCICHFRKDIYTLSYPRQLESQTHPQDDHVDRITDCSTRYGQAPAVCTRVSLAKRRWYRHAGPPKMFYVIIPPWDDAGRRQLPILLKIPQCIAAISRVSRMKEYHILWLGHTQSAKY